MTNCSGDAKQNPVHTDGERFPGVPAADAGLQLRTGGDASAQHHPRTPEATVSTAIRVLLAAVSHPHAGEPPLPGLRLQPVVPRAEPSQKLVARHRGHILQGDDRI